MKNRKPSLQWMPNTQMEIFKRLRSNEKKMAANFKMAFKILKYAQLPYVWWETLGILPILLPYL